MDIKRYMLWKKFACSDLSDRKMNFPIHKIIQPLPLAREWSELHAEPRVDSITKTEVLIRTRAVRVRTWFKNKAVKLMPNFVGIMAIPLFFQRFSLSTKNTSKSVADIHFRCFICVSCSVHVISTYYVRKGS